MKLKNKALQELYNTIVNCTITISPYANSPIDKAFKECDDCLKDLQDRNDILEKSNVILLDANLDLCSKNRDLKNRIEQLEKDHESDVRVIGKLHSQMVNLEDEKTEQEKRADILKSQRDMLKKELDSALEAKKTVNDSRYKWAQKWLSTKQNLEAKLNEAERKLDDLTSQYQDGQSDLWDMLQNVNDAQPNEFDVECNGMEDVIGMDLEDFLDIYKKWQEQKETDRMRNWLADFCVGRVCKECPLGSHEYKCGCGYSFNRRDRFDIRIIPDEDIKRYYEKARGCGRYPFAKSDDPCSGAHEKIKEACDAFSEGLKAGLASEVKEVPVSCDIPIKDLGSWGCTIEGNFEINKDILDKVCGVKPKEEKSKPGEMVITTRGVTTVNYWESTMKAIKEAVRKFEKSLPALDSWESTITGSIKVDDILGKTNGTEHKLEYGDAVRLPWRNYDYMYIGPDDKVGTLVRLFDPKNHAIVTTHVSNIRYNGGKIIICDEDDLRKIWKDKG